MTDNVIQFPKRRVNTATRAELGDLTDEQRVKVFNTNLLVEMMMNDIAHRLNAEGYDIDNETFQYEYEEAVDHVKRAVLTSIGIYI